MRNGKTVSNLWRIDDGNDRVGMDFLTHPTALVRTQEDADFIAESRTDLPRALDEVRRLRADLAEAEAILKVLQARGTHVGPVTATAQK
jgi:hypothetical protein